MFWIAKELEEFGDPLAGVTPALNWIKSKALRVRSGTRSMVSEVINCPTVELLVSARSLALRRLLPQLLFRHAGRCRPS
jgi:hypothetical protein